MPPASTQTELIDIAAIAAELRPQSTAKLKLRFFECYSGAARLIAEAAVCVKLLIERGEDLKGVPMVGTFRRVAEGQILPELVWKFIESPNRQRVERLPLDDQRRIAADPMVAVAEGQTVRKIDLTQAPPDVAKVVIGPDGIRSPEEQRAYLGQQKVREAHARRPATPTTAFDRTLTVGFTTTEFSSLIENAARAGLSDRDYIRHLLDRSGAFARPKP